MTDRTSISVSVELKQELDSLKEHEQQSYENLLWELIEESEVDNSRSELIEDIRDQLDRIESAQGGTVSEALDIADSSQEVTLEATEYQKIAEEVSEALR